MTNHDLPEHQAWMSTPVELPELPWAKDGLEPIISANTIDYHYGKHHKAYVDKTLELVKGTDLEGKSLELIMDYATRNADKKVLFNNSAQIWNHSFYWKCLAPKGTVKPSDELKALIDRDFGSWEEFRKQLIQAGMTQFGSGWAWVVVEGGKLSILKTPNADEPHTETASPVLTLDVWEHAYYLDYQNKRQAYLEAVIDNLVNWHYVEVQIEKHLG
jgi:Fe-Mn family superoxide dismutase